MKKTLLLFFTLLVIGGGNLLAAKKYATLSSLTNGPSSTWDVSTNTITWTGTSNNMVSYFDFAAGDYKQYTKIGVTISSITNADYVRVQIRANGKELTQCFSGTGTIEKSLTTDYGFTVADLENFEWARLLGSSWQTPAETHTIDAENPASAVISEVYLEAPTRTKDVDLSTMSASEGNATWNNSTSTFAWTGTWTNAITLPGLSGNLSAYTTVNYVTAAGTADHFRILIYYSNGASQTTYQASVGTKSVTFADMGVVTANLAHILSIKISGASDFGSQENPGNITLTSFSLEGPEVSYISASTTYENPDGTTNLNSLTGTNTGWSVSYPSTLGSAGIFCGNGDGSSESTHVTITDYDYICFEVTEVTSGGQPLRVWIWDGSTVQTLYAYPIADYATATWTTQNTISSTGTYVVKISDYDYLKGMKTPNNGWGGSITISTAYLSSGTAPVAYKSTGVYTLYGETTGASSLTSALADASATYYDATGVAGTGIDLTPTGNSNALFKANSGVLSNSNNVIVGSTCASLVLRDGYAFKAPADFTATSASYNMTLNETAKAGTLCLPFEATIPEGVTAYTLAYTSGDAATATEITTGTIPANTPVLLNGSGTVTFTGTSAAVDADAVNTSGAMTGVFESTTVPEDSYVLQDGDSGVGFYKVSSAITANPFRAYLTAQGAGAKLRIIFPDEANSIQTVEAAKADDGIIYNLNGQRVSYPTKGIYIKNGKKFINK